MICPYEKSSPKKRFDNNELMVAPKKKNFSFPLASILLFIKNILFILFLTNP